MGWGSGERLVGWMSTGDGDNGGSCRSEGKKRSINPKFFGWSDRGPRGSKWVTFMSPDAHQPPWMDLAIRWNRGHANGRGAAMSDSGAFDWKSAVKSSTSMWGWSWVNLLHVNATLHGRLNQNSRCYPFFFFFFLQWPSPREPFLGRSLTVSFIFTHNQISILPFSLC